MYLLIDGNVALPPTSASCLRDITLYAKTFSNLTPLIECKREQRDTIWHWLKHKSAFDFIDDMVRRDTVTGLSIGYRRKCNICVTRIGYNNLDFIISRLKQSAWNPSPLSYEIPSLLDDLKDSE
jgi:hypothetical protein